MIEEPASSEDVEAHAEVVPLSRRETVFLATMAFAWFLVLAALLGPWFSFVTKVGGSSPSTDDRGFGVFGWSSTETATGVTITVSGNYVLFPSTGALLLILGIATAAIALLGLAAIVLKYVELKGREVGRQLGVLGYVAGASALVVPVAFALVFPTAAAADGILFPGSWLFGSTSRPPTSWTWSLGWAWYCLLVAGGLFVWASHVLATWRARAPAKARTL